MSWILKQAINKMCGFVKRSKDLKVPIYANDIQALETLLTGIENSSEKYVIDNILFAKLLAIQLRQEIQHFGDVKMAIKNVGISLSQPLSSHIEFLRLQINDTEDLNYFKELGLDFDKDTAETRELKKTILEEGQQDIFKKISSYWSFDKVSKSFYSTANDFLKDLNNYS